MIHNDISPNDQAKLKQTLEIFSRFSSLHFINAEGYLQSLWKKIPNQYHFSCEVLYKLIAPSLFPQYDKIIISDVDVVFLGDITKSFFEFDCEEDYLIGGVISNNPEAFFPLPPSGWRSGYKKFSPSNLKAIQYGAGGGYLLINLKQWRKVGAEERCIDCLKNNAKKLVLAEQDIINLVCFPHIKKISLAHIVSHSSWESLGEQWEKLKPNLYTQEEILEAREHPIQLHYVGADKPWNTPSVPKSDLWFSYLAKTLFLEDYLNKLETIFFQKFQKRLLIYRALKFFQKHPLFLISPSFYQRIFHLVKRWEK